MKIQLTIHDKTLSIESDNDHYCVTEMAEMFRGILTAAGFHPASVDSLFDPDTIEPWVMPDVEISYDKKND